jgi:hypothetical protein
MPRRISASVVLVLILLLTNCSSSTNPNSPSVDLSGTWSGLIQDSAGGAGTLRVTFVQSGNSLSGMWTALFSNPANNKGGNLTGTVNGNVIAAMFTTAGPCSYGVSFTLNGNQIIGTYTSGNTCAAVVSGNFTLTKQ